MPDLGPVTAIAAREAEALGLALVRVAWFAHGTEGESEEPALQVMAERPDTRQLMLEECAELSRRISAVLDALEEQGRDPLPGGYRLEVSSPGIDRPLTRLADFADWAGHEARLSLSQRVGNRAELRGTLAGLDGEGVLLDERKSGRLAIPFGDIAEARLILTDRLIAATRPLDPAGADEIIDEPTDLQAQDD